MEKIISKVLDFILMVYIGTDVLLRLFLKCQFEHPSLNTHKDKFICGGTSESVTR